MHLMMLFSFVFLDSPTQTPDTVERRKLAIVQEVLYGHDKVNLHPIKYFYTFLLVNTFYQMPHNS